MKSEKMLECCAHKASPTLHNYYIATPVLKEPKNNLSKLYVNLIYTGNTSVNVPPFPTSLWTLISHHWLRPICSRRSIPGPMPLALVEKSGFDSLT